MSATMRVELAKDVLFLLDDEDTRDWLHIAKGTYFSPEYDLYSYEEYEKNAPVGPQLVNNHIRVCALGVLFTAYMLFHKPFGCRDFSGFYGYLSPMKAVTMAGFLMEAFPEKMLSEIEYAFEEMLPSSPFDGYSCHRRRLRAIMNNIVRNRGDFSLAEEEIFLLGKMTKLNFLDKLVVRFGAAFDQLTLRIWGKPRLAWHA